MNDKTPDQAPLSAADLRKQMAELEFHNIEKMQRKRQAAEDAMAKFVEHFTRESLSEKEIEQMRTKARHAAELGETELVVMKFPAKLCTDDGRAINNGEANWPETLSGKAKDLYQVWNTTGREQGFGLKAMILDFPGGMPGDVGLIISWGE